MVLVPICPPSWADTFKPCLPPLGLRLQEGISTVLGKGLWDGLQAPDVGSTFSGEAKSILGVESLLLPGLILFSSQVLLRVYPQNDPLSSVSPLSPFCLLFVGTPWKSHLHSKSWSPSHLFGYSSEDPCTPGIVPVLLLLLLVPPSGCWLQQDSWLICSGAPWLCVEGFFLLWH